MQMILKNDSILKHKLDILITGGTVLTMTNGWETIEHAAVGIKDGTIRFVARTDEIPLHDVQAHDTIDALGSLVMPGLINTHTHLPMVCFRGLADDLPLMDWLNNYIFPAEARYVNRDMVYHGAMLAIAEMILSGTTTFCDGYFYESRVARAAVDAGMRALPCQGFIDFPTKDNPNPADNIAIAEKFLDKWESVSPLITPAFFCHAPYTCSPETLMTIKQIARERGVLYLTHLAETRDEVHTIRERYGRTPVRHLHDIGVLDEHTVAVHCTWVDDEEIAIMAETGTRVSHNPESNMKLAAGIAPVPKMIDAGITVGLGTDGCASNNDLDLFSEMDMAAKVHKVALLDPTVMDASTVLRMATIDGAKVLGIDDMVGSVETGKRADLIIIDMNKPHLTPLYNNCSHLVYAASGADVMTSIIDGQVVMRDRRILTFDVDDIMREVRRIGATIRNGYNGPSY